jgi:hypothetical protein
MQLKKVRPGQTITTNPLNALVDIANRSAVDFTRGQATRSPGQLGLFVVNATGADLPAGAVAALDLATPTELADADAPAAFIEDGPAILLAEPTGAEGEILVILAEAIPDAGGGRAHLRGLTMARLNLTDVDHAYAEVDTDDPHLLKSASSQTPQKIVWAPGTTGEGWALILLDGAAGGGSATLQVVQITSAVSAGTCSVKNVSVKSDPTLSPNYELSGDAYTVNYYKE